VIRSRLLADITNGKSSGLGRECELLGKDKEVDMWVHNTAVQIGIFQGIAGDAGKLLDKLNEQRKEPTEQALPEH
jgi:hypothetical protein